MKPTYEELQAQVEVLKDWRRLALQFDGQRMQAISLLKQIAANNFSHEEVKSFLAAAPVSGNAHLSEIKADAGRAGFVAGAMEWGGIGFAATVEANADEYAEKIKQGGTA
jgi:hypothetical protein